MRLAVIGGGIIGLAGAWYLARAGVEVVVFERDTPGRAASWAAAGMLIADLESESEHPGFLSLARVARTRWPGFAEALRAATGQDVDLNFDGTTVVVTDDAQERHWRSLVLRRQKDSAHSELLADLAPRWLTRRDVLERLPGASRATQGGVLSPSDGHVDNRAATRALVRAVEAAGVEIREQTLVSGLVTTGGRVSAVRTLDANRIEGQMEVDGVVLAAGPWSGDIDGLPAGLSLPLSPVKGQMAAVTGDASDPRYPRGVVWGDGIYCVPRQDGRIILGATMEDVGYQSHVTAGAVSGLIARASAILPDIHDMPLHSAWSGFRPTMPDRLPVIGRTGDMLGGALAGLDGLTIATGHHRNGILLAPVTAELISDLALGRRPRHEISAFSPGRFTRRDRDRSQVLHGT